MWRAAGKNHRYSTDLRLPTDEGSAQVSVFPYSIRASHVHSQQLRAGNGIELTQLLTHAIETEAYNRRRCYCKRPDYSDNSVTNSAKAGSLIVKDKKLFTDS